MNSGPRNLSKASAFSYVQIRTVRSAAVSQASVGPQSLPPYRPVTLTGSSLNRAAHAIVSPLLRRPTPETALDTWPMVRRLHRFGTLLEQQMMGTGSAESPVQQLWSFPILSA